MPLFRDLVGAWSLAVDGRDGSGNGRHAVVHGRVGFTSAGGPAGSAGGAGFAGTGRLAVELGGGRGEGWSLARGDFTLAGWIRPATSGRQPLGDVAALREPRTRRGLSLEFLDSSPTGNHGNDRELAVSIDDGTPPTWRDLGRPGEATIMVCGLAVLDGMLFAATWEGAPSELGHVYRLEADRWIDCGAPGDSNAVSRLAIHKGALYAGTSRLRGGGSAMPDSTNRAPGGRVFRYEGGTDWTDCGRIDGADSIAGLVPFDGRLHAIPMYSEGLFRMDAPGRWTSCGTPGRRLLAIGAHGDALLGAGNDHADVDSAIAQTAAGIVVAQREASGGGGVFRYGGGTGWTSLGLQPDTTQVYSIETYGGAAHVGTWPSGLVFRLETDGTWRSLGRLGDETEVMNLFAWNGALYAGTLPHAQVFRFDGPGAWTDVGRLDTTPDVLYRRAASMAVHRGTLAVGTLPSGHVHAMRVGQAVSSGRALDPGWHHVAAVRRGPVLELHLDGRLVGSDRSASGAALDLGAPGTLVLGGGPRADFAGDLAAVQLVGRALDPGEIATLATSPAA
jgi:hypothetical protein